MNKIRTLILMTLVTLSLTGCDELVSKFSTPDDLDVIGSIKSDKKDVIEVHKIEFSPDYKTFTVTTRMNGDIGPYGLTDTTSVRTEVEASIGGVPENEHSAPRLIKMYNTKSENVAKNDVQVLALIDLTQSQEVLDRIKSHLIELHAVFNDSNLFVSFAVGAEISPTTPLTRYVLDTHLVASKEQYAYLYRAIVQKYDEMITHQGPFANARRLVLLVFSDCEIYDNNTNLPVDPDHYTYEEEIAQKSNHPERNMMVCHANMSRKPDNPNSESFLMINHFCEATNGIYMYPYNGTEFKNNILKEFSISPDANKFIFENPDGKVYRGAFETLKVKFVSIHQDTLIASFQTVINKGDLYNPIIINSEAIPIIILKGLIITCIIALFIWLVLQFLVPYIRYRLFCRKYVVRYTGHNMGMGYNVVSESCYLCKEPFDIDDEIVVKCNHTMHKSCWDENDYHCTEFGDRCKHGSHYYNHANLFDTNNAPFFTKWILAGIFAIALAWIQFVSRSHHVTTWLVTKASLFLTGIEAGTPEAAELFDDSSISPLSSFGFSIGLFMTLAIILLTAKQRNIRHNIVKYLLRALIAAFMCFIAFLIINILVVVLGIGDYAFLVEWIPWVSTAIIVSFWGTYNARVALRKQLLLLYTAVTIICFYLWWLFYSDNIDYRLMILIVFLFYGGGLSLCIASIVPRSERYFLRVEGAVKEMEIALYKWFRNSPDRIVTIGKSVDCSLQLSWDVSGFVAPIHAEIRMRNNVPYLRAVEEGVLVNAKPLTVGKEVSLHHGMSFSIANTKMTYIEKDLAL